MIGFVILRCILLLWAYLNPRSRLQRPLRSSSQFFLELARQLELDLAVLFPTSVLAPFNPVQQSVFDQYFQCLGDN